MNCDKCSYGPRSPLSDVCDGCTNDPDTGWGGFIDHCVDKHFTSEEEQQKYYDSMDEEDD